MIYMFQLDSTHGNFHSTVKVAERRSHQQKRAIFITQDGDPVNINWGVAGAKFFMESTGVLKIMKEAGDHL